MNKNFLLVMVLFSLVYSSINAQELMSYTNPKEYTMPAKLIPTERKYWVSLPKDYNQTTNRYPIIFLFDGNEEYLKNLMLFDIDQLTRYSEMPPCIIVGIIQRNRILDFGPLYAVKSNPNSDKVNGDKFFDFIKQELLPELNKNYRTQEFKVGIGHSLGGLFLLNSFTKDPEFFNGIVAVSPALEMDRDSTLFKNVETTLKSKINKQTFFCWASGTEGVNEVVFRPGSDALHKLLVDNKNPAFKFNYIDLPGRTHTLTPIYSMLNALDFLFSSWNIAKWYRGLFYDKDIDPIIEYSTRKALMKKVYGFVEDPTEDRIQNNVGLQLLSAHKYELALPYLVKAVKSNPFDSSYHENLSMAEEKLKHYSQALTAIHAAIDNLDKSAEDYNDRLESYQSSIKRLESLNKP
jgi:predicted alpha/beta superfamily hydrolase